MDPLQPVCLTASDVAHGDVSHSISLHLTLTLSHNSHSICAGNTEVHYALILTSLASRLIPGFRPHVVIDTARNGFAVTHCKAVCDAAHCDSPTRLAEPRPHALPAVVATCAALAALAALAAFLRCCCCDLTAPLFEQWCNVRDAALGHPPSTLTMLPDIIDACELPRSLLVCPYPQLVPTACGSVPEPLACFASRCRPLGQAARRIRWLLETLLPAI